MVLWVQQTTCSSAGHAGNRCEPHRGASADSRPHDPTSRSDLHEGRRTPGSDATCLTCGPDRRQLLGQHGTLRSVAPSRWREHGARTLFTRMPARPVPQPASKVDAAPPRYPYERIALALRTAIDAGMFARSRRVRPAGKGAGAAADVAVATAQRAVSQLHSWGYVDVQPRRGVRVIEQSRPAHPKASRPLGSRSTWRSGCLASSTAGLPSRPIIRTPGSCGSR